MSFGSLGSLTASRQALNFLIVHVQGSAAQQLSVEGCDVAELIAAAFAPDKLELGERGSPGAFRFSGGTDVG